MNFMKLENMKKIAIEMAVISQVEKGGIEAVVKMANKI